MTLTIKKCLAVLSVAVVIALYAAAAYRIEMARQAPRFVVMCNADHCAPQDATFAGLSLK
jgi:hypothetical protein